MQRLDTAGIEAQGLQNLLHGCDVIARGCDTRRLIEQSDGIGERGYGAQVNTPGSKISSGELAQKCMTDAITAARIHSSLDMNTNVRHSDCISKYATYVS